MFGTKIDIKCHEKPCALLYIMHDFHVFCLFSNLYFSLNLSYDSSVRIL